MSNTDNVFVLFAYTRLFIIRHNMGKLDITSSAVEKGLDLAKDFLDKLIIPSVEETGLLLKDRVTYWRFKNQVKMLNKAKEFCEKNKISPKSISVKLLYPLLENAALEEDDLLQDKWAILLSNMVDSDQNIENHVFPYILSQISKNEFEILEGICLDKKERIKKLESELAAFVKNKPMIEQDLKEQIEKLKGDVEEKRSQQGHDFREVWKVQKQIMDKEQELRSLGYKEGTIKRSMLYPEHIPDEYLREYEMSNLIRLGLAKAMQETYGSRQTLEIPNDPDKEYLTVDVDIDVESENYHVLTELGELFIDACTEKQNQSV